MCHTRAFWKPIFDQYNYPFPTQEIHTVSEWINQFYMMKNKDEIEDIMDNLNKRHTVELNPIRPIVLSSLITLADQSNMTPEFVTTLTGAINYIQLNRDTTQSKRRIYYVFFIIRHGATSFICNTTQLKLFLSSLFRRDTFDVIVNK